MSTHAALGVKMPDDSIVGCYVHYDGATMDERIQSYLGAYTTTDLAVLITQAQSAGGIRSFYCPAYDKGDGTVVGPPETELMEGGDTYAIDESDFYEDHMGTYAWYLVNYETGSIQKKDRY